MLYGVRDKYQKKLVRDGKQLRLYLPFEKDWWLYAIRRISESPKNIKFLFRSLFFQDKPPALGRWLGVFNVYFSWNICF
jgi:proline dehydrogenase